MLYCNEAMSQPGKDKSGLNIIAEGGKFVRDRLKTISCISRRSPVKQCGWRFFIGLSFDWELFFSGWSFFSFVLNHAAAHANDPVDSSQYIQYTHRFLKFPTKHETIKQNKCPFSASQLYTRVFSPLGTKTTGNPPGPRTPTSSPSSTGASSLQDWPSSYCSKYVSPLFIAYDLLLIFRQTTERNCTIRSK